MVNDLAAYKMYSTFDFKSAYQNLIGSTQVLKSMGDSTSLHIFIMFLLVSYCYCNVVQIWEGVPESFLIDYLVHRSLEHGNSVGHTKRYTTELVESPIDFKTCVLPIRF